VISLAIGFTPVKADDGTFTFGLYDVRAGFWIVVFFSIFCLLLTAFLIFVFRTARSFTRQPLCSSPL
jgi:hypothetical protein